MNAIELERASVRVGGRTVWRDVDVEIGEGEFVAVLGPNGVGKSTLVKVLLGLLPLETGRAVVLGHPVGESRHEIGYLPQRRSFDSALRIRGVDVVRLGLDGDRWGLPLRRNRDATARLDDAIGRVGASGFAHRPIGQLSGGEQQRLLIAQALVRRPRLLLLDEPLDSLDLPNQRGIAALVASICHDDGVTVVLVAHDVNPILTFLDRVVYLGHAGVASGTPEDVVTTETLSRLYQSPIEVLTASDGRLVVVGQPDTHSHHHR